MLDSVKVGHVTNFLKVFIERFMAQDDPAIERWNRMACQHAAKSPTCH